MDSMLFIVTAVLMLLLGSVYVAGRERNKRKVLAFKAAATMMADFLAVIAALQELAYKDFPQARQYSFSYFCMGLRSFCSVPI